MSVIKLDHGKRIKAPSLNIATPVNMQDIHASQTQKMLSASGHRTTWIAAANVNTKHQHKSSRPAFALMLDFLIAAKHAASFSWKIGFKAS